MCDGLPDCPCPNCATGLPPTSQLPIIAGREWYENAGLPYPISMPAKVELRGLLPLIDKLRGNPDKLECLGLELQLVIDRYTYEVEQDLKSFAETSPHLSQPDEDFN